MPYLNWKDQTRVQQQIGPVAEAVPEGVPESARRHMSLVLESSALRELLPLLRETLVENSPELRLDLPRGWIVFWKRRDGESRLLVAHPQADEWVATIALSEEHARLAIERLEGLAPGSRLDLGALAPTGSVSNLELTVSHQGAVAEATGRAGD